MDVTAPVWSRKPPQELIQHTILFIKEAEQQTCGVAAFSGRWSVPCLQAAQTAVCASAYKQDSPWPTFLLQWEKRGV